MKLNKTLVTVMSALAFAGAAVGGSVAAVEPVSSIVNSIDGTVSVGYDSSYIFRGVSLGDDAIWTGVDLSTPAPLLAGATLGLGAWYINPTQADTSDELDLYLSISQSFGSFDVGVGYTAYLYPETNADASGELSLGVGTQVVGVDVGALYAYDHDLETHYFEVSGGVDGLGGFPVDLDLVIGFNEDSYAYTAATASAPLEVNDSVTFTPYVSVIFRDEDELAGEDDDEIFAGASLSVRF